MVKIRAARSTLCSGVAERDGDKMRSVAGLHPHQHCFPAIGLSIRHGLADVGRGRDRLAIDIENEIAGPKTVACGAVLIDLRHHDAIAVARRRQRQPQLGQFGGRRLALLGLGARLALLGQFAERQGEGVLTAVAEDAELDRGARCQRADPPSKAAPHPRPDRH